MSLFGRKKDSLICNHTWRKVGIETGYFNAGSSVDIDDYVVLSCSRCGDFRKVPDYEAYRLIR